MVSLRPCKKGYLAASSLIESVIAITIITVCLLIALKLYITVLEGRPSANDHRLRFQIDKLVSEMKLNPSFDSETYEFETFKIHKNVSDYEDLERLKKISYTVVTQSDTITYHHLITKQNEDLP